MKKKIVGIFVSMLLIATALPAVGIMTISNTKTSEPNDPQPIATQTGYLSVPAAAFTPEDQLNNYDNYGSYLTGVGWFYAPVYLHNEATVTKLTFYWSDLSVANDAHLLLIRYPFGGSEDQMADIYSSGSGGAGSDWDITINFPVIDNTRYSYFLCVSLNDIFSIFYYNAVIEYTYVCGVSIGEETVENEQTQVSQDSGIPLRER
jgi:hypothetical protein